MPYFVYFLKSLKDGKFYVGVKDNFERRLAEHNNGLSKSTRGRRPFITTRIEEYSDIQSAYKRERFLKSKKSSKIIKHIIGSN